MKPLSVACVLSVATAACSEQASHRGREFSQQYALPPIAEAEAPELRIWLNDFESGYVRGFVARPGEVSVYRGDDVEVVITSYGDQLTMMIPQLSRARVDRCQPVADGGRVVIEGVDSGGAFSFAVDNYFACEGYNLHLVDRAIEAATNVPTAAD